MNWQLVWYALIQSVAKSKKLSMWKLCNSVRNVNFNFLQERKKSIRSAKTYFKRTKNYELYVERVTFCLNVQKKPLRSMQKIYYCRVWFYAILMCKWTTPINLTEIILSAIYGVAYWFLLKL